VSPVFANVYVGQMVQFSATLNGRTEATGDDEIQWSTIDPSVAEVSEDGWVTGLKPGNVTIAAGCRNHCGTARVMGLADPGSDEEGPSGGTTH